MKLNSYRSFLKRLSVRQVASITSLIVLALALPIGLFLTEQTQELRQQAYLLPISTPVTPPQDKSFCNTDNDCGCALDTQSGQCAVQNQAYLHGNCTQPDYCSGISGNLRPACVNNSCTLIDASQPTPTPGFSAVSCSSPQTSSYSTYFGSHSIRLQPYAATAGGNDAIVGYQWDFEGDGVWDIDRFVDHGWVDYTYNIPGVFVPKYRVRGIYGYSNTCTVGYTFDIRPSTSPTPSPSLPASPSPSPSPTTSKFDMDGNGYINLLDYGLFITGFISTLNQ